MSPGVHAATHSAPYDSSSAAPPAPRGLADQAVGVGRCCGRCLVIRRTLIGCAKLRFVIEVRRLRVLRALADHGTVTAAAEVLHLTPSAVSQQLAALESEVGQELLERRGRR